ncbi:MAG: nuclear transport factor 2 family protein [Pseudomonadota bacterium]
MTRAEIETMIRACYDARHRENLDEALSFFSPDATFRLVANPSLPDLSVTLRGQGELRAGLEALFATWDWHDFPIQRLVIDAEVDPHGVVVLSAGTMHHSPSTRQLPLEIVDVLTVQDGKILDFQEYLDTDLLGKFLTS